MTCVVHGVWILAGGAVQHDIGQLRTTENIREVLWSSCSGMTMVSSGVASRWIA